MPIPTKSVFDPDDSIIKITKLTAFEVKPGNGVLVAGAFKRWVSSAG